MKKFLMLAGLFIFMAPAMTSAGWLSETKEDMKVGFVNMNQAGLNEINRQVSEYGKQLAEKNGFSASREELKRAEKEARNTPEAIALKEKIKPLLEAWERVEKAGGSGNVEEVKAAEEDFKKFMENSEIKEAYGRFHNITADNENVIAKRKEFMAINKEIKAQSDNKRGELVNNFYKKIKVISSKMAEGGKYNAVLGITEFSPDGKTILKKVEILYIDEKYAEDITDKISGRLKFY